MKIVLVVLAAIIASVVAVPVWHGALLKIAFAEGKTSAMTIVYEPHTGPYPETGKVMAGLYERLKAAGIETRKGVSLYFDDPKKVEAAQCRSEVGCLLEGEALKDLPRIRKNFKVKQLPEIKAWVAVFPYRTVLSIVIGVSKVYPAWEAFSKDKTYSGKYPFVMEIYDLPGKQIQYIFPQ